MLIPQFRRATRGASVGSVLMICCSLAHGQTPRQPVVGSNLLHSPNPALLSNGTDTSEMSRAIWHAACACTELQVWYPGFYLAGSGAEVLAPNPLEVTAAIEYPIGTITPLTWTGSRSLTLSPGGAVASDACPVSIPGPANYTVIGGATVNTLISSAPTTGPLAPAQYDLVAFTSGVLVGQWSMVKSFNAAAGQITLTGPVPAAPSVGDGIRISKAFYLRTHVAGLSGGAAWAYSRVACNTSWEGAVTNGADQTGPGSGALSSYNSVDLFDATAITGEAPAPESAACVASNPRRRSATPGVAERNIPCSDCRATC